MRFDDSLKTVLAADASTSAGARATFRQLVDLIGRGRVTASDDLLARLKLLRERVPVRVRAACARSLSLCDAPLPLVAFFAGDDAEVAGAALRAVRLDPEGWEALLPRLAPSGRAVVRGRRDLPPSIVRSLDSFGATDFVLSYRPAVDGHADAAPVMPETPRARAVPQRYAVADLVERLKAHQRTATTQVDDVVVPLSRFHFETDASGVIRWVDAAPRGAVIGLSLNHANAGDVASHVDGVAAGAFRKRARFADARLVVPGISAIAGDWRISATPMFDPASGSFIGMRGHARRPRTDEGGFRSPGDGRRGGAEGLRRLVHELRTPTNAIAGFSELIEQELLGPIAPAHRERASDIRRRITGLIGAIEDLDLAARIDGDALDLRPGTVALSPLLQEVRGELAQLARLRDAALSLPPAGDAAWAVDPHNAARLVSRLFAVLLSAARPGERLAVSLIGGTGTLALSISGPAAFAGRTEASLLSLDDEDASGDDGAPLLGVGFALRLVRNLAVQLGGRLTVAPDRFTVLLPSAAADDGPEHSSIGAP